MDIQKAIDVIKTEKECVLRNIKGCDRDCGKCDLVMDDSVVINSYDMAISALEKQIPYKPTPYMQYKGKCVCGAVFLDKWTKHCGNCGQRLDWSDCD